MFLTVTLGAPPAVVGLIEGLAEGATVAILGNVLTLRGRWFDDRPMDPHPADTAPATRPGIAP